MRRLKEAACVVMDQRAVLICSQHVVDRGAFEQS